MFGTPFGKLKVGKSFQFQNNSVLFQKRVPAREVIKFAWVD